MAILYLHQKDINYLLWDRCINNSLNGLVYSLSWYLDIVAEKWDALVEDDYRAVMPLVYTNEFLYQKIYTPALIKQLGIFSVKPLSESKMDQFVELIPKSFKKVDICFNRHNFQSNNLKNHCQVLKTFEMDLIISYDKKSKSYSSNVKTALEIANNKKLQVLKGISISELELFISHYGEKNSGHVILKPLKQVMSQLINSGRAEIIGVYNNTNMLISVACFIKSNQNIILIYALTSDQGVEEKANYCIMDSFIKGYSSRNITLSLDHNDESWSLQFYYDLGALESNYLHLKENKMPFFLKWL